MIRTECCEFRSDLQTEARLVEGMLNQTPATSTDVALDLAAGVGRDFLACEVLYLNSKSDTVHRVVAHGRVWIDTKYYHVPPRGPKPMRLHEFSS